MCVGGVLCLGIDWCTHEQQQTLVFPNGAAAAQEAEQEEHGAHGQDHIDSGEEQRIGCYDLPESCRIHQHPDSHSE